MPASCQRRASVVPASCQRRARKVRARHGTGKTLVVGLSGEAAQTISGYQISSENYDKAIELLEKRFGNKQVIVSRYIEDLMLLPKVSSKEGLRGLRLLYDKMEATTRSLKSIGVQSESHNAVLSPVIMSKLPSELRLLISRKIGEE